MIESLISAHEELKRVDHQIFVSLKYTRTCDVLINIIRRMIDAYDHIFAALLKSALQKNQIYEIPDTPKEVGHLVKQTFPEDIVQRSVMLYFLFRKILKSTYQREQEYRRHVTLRTYIDGKEETLDIDIVTEYYYTLRELFAYTEERIKAGSQGSIND
ncbi:hypothetical protein JW868_03005 [Candidatus Woesearchaeota archaeon]|nr:hypothetical protein [Candidatus Woesearchaeota archaeon]